MWNFKKDKKDFVYFEELILDYLKRNYPLNQWVPTKLVGDNNRDAEGICGFRGQKCWAEAKYKRESKKALSSRRFDSTLVSSFFIDDVYKIYFFSNTEYNDPLINRVTKFCLNTNIEKSIFIGGRILENWISKNEQIQKEYFVSWDVQPSEKNKISSHIDIYHNKDSVTYNSLGSNSAIISLFDLREYEIQLRVEAWNYEKNDIKITCNELPISDCENISSGIYTFSLNQYLINNVGKKTKTMDIHIQFHWRNSTIKSEIFQLNFKEYIEMFPPQKRARKFILDHIENQQIIEIYGQANTGKSELLNHVKSEMMFQYKKKAKVIYINFRGTQSDIVYLTRMIFQFVYDYYEDCNYDELLKTCQKLKLDFNIYTVEIVEKLIQAMISEDETELANIISHIIYSPTNQIFNFNQFTDKKCFFFLDNTNMLSVENRHILSLLLRSFVLNKGISIIYTCQMKNSFHHHQDIELDFLNQNEIKKEIINIKSYEESELNYLIEDCSNTSVLKYPRYLANYLIQLPESGLLEHTINYINSYSSSFLPINMESHLRDLIHLASVINDGIPIQYFRELTTVQSIEQLFSGGYLYLENSLVYTEYEVKEEIKNISKLLQRLTEIDISNQFKYMMILSAFSADYFSQHSKELLFHMETLYKENKFYRIVFYSRSLLLSIKSQDRIVHDMKYYLAMSLMHCGENKTASEILFKISKDSCSSVAIHHLIESEVIDIKFWEFIDIDTLPNIINKKRIKITKKTELNNLPWNDQRAYLTMTNRLMTTYLLRDELILANELFNENIVLACKLNEKCHIGYTLMDYAKGIYHIDLNRAAIFLEEAERIFESLDNEPRRLIDCQCELCYVNNLLKRDDLESFHETQKKLFNHGYWAQYNKSVLKEILLLSLEEKFDYAKLKYRTIKSNEPFLQNERVKYLCAIFDRYFYQIPISYNFDFLGNNSYKLLLKKEFKISSLQANKVNISLSIYSLDPRVW